MKLQATKIAAFGLVGFFFGWQMLSVINITIVIIIIIKTLFVTTINHHHAPNFLCNQAICERLMQSTTRFTCTFKVNLYSLNIQLSRFIIDIFPANRLLSDELTSPRAGFLVGVILNNCALYIFTN